MEHVLDNPAWNALISGNKNLAEGNGRVKFFPADISPFAGMPEFNPDNFRLLYESVALKRTLALIAPEEIVIPQPWEIREDINILQMVYDHSSLPALSQIKTAIIPLQKKNVPEMLALTKMMRPGPFLERTIDFGHYEGIFKDGRLIAMAGQRLHANQYREISAVCTHPDHLGKGYAGLLIIRQIHRIKAAGGIPFLHVKDNNNGAIRLYETIGFNTRRQVKIYIIRK